jgi:hypothetical protein
MAVTGRYTYRLGTQAEIVESYVPFGIPLRERFVAQAFQQVCMGLWPMCPRHPRSHTIHPELLSHTFSHSSNVPLGRMEDSVLRQMGELSMHRREVLLTLPGR